MSLFTVFGKDPDKVEERIGDLEAEIMQLEREKERAEELNRENSRKAEQQGRRAGHKDKALRQIEQRLQKVNALEGEVEVVDYPRVAYKSVDTGIATLLIPQGATIVHPWFSNRPHKRRTDEVDVLRIDGSVGSATDIGASSTASTNSDPMRGFSDTAASTINYEVGETFTPSDGEPHTYIQSEATLNEDVEQECAGGIHFFRERSEAVDWHTRHN